MINKEDLVSLPTARLFQKIIKSFQNEWWYGTDEVAYRTGSTEGLRKTYLCSTTTLYDLQKWLRETQKLHITIYSKSQESWQYKVTKEHQALEDALLSGEDFETYEKALDDAIFKSLEYVINEMKVD